MKQIKFLKQLILLFLFALWVSDNLMSSSIEPTTSSQALLPTIEIPPPPVPNMSPATVIYSLKLTHIASKELPQGTHRPEILVSDTGDIYLIVVHPSEQTGVGQIKHRVYRYDSNWNQIGDAYAVTWTDAIYGEPADHRAAIVNKQLVIVYQTLIYKDNIPPNTGGPAEDFAKEQSLMLARYSLEGTELFRGPIVAHVTDFTRDSFPDHCLLWRDDRFIVSTGIKNTGPIEQKTINIREVDLNGTILSTHKILSSPTEIPEMIGNSLFYRDGSVFMLSGGVMLNQLKDTLDGVVNTWSLEQEDVDATFPTGNLSYEGFILVGFNGRQPGGDYALENNPYSPYLMILDSSYNQISVTKIGDTGFAHVHPTLANSGSRLFLAWSKRLTSDGSRYSPQVNVEEFVIRKPRLKDN